MRVGTTTFCAAAIMLLANAGPAYAQQRVVMIGDQVVDGRIVVRHVYRCDGCGPRRQERAGHWRRRATVDYGQALPVYQPPLFTHPGHVVPAVPVRPRSGSYAVTGGPVPRDAQRREGYGATGSMPRIITIPPRASRRN
ncbi:hypothetical protein [Phreatobacter sp.]|uniref:hypothetical protein n=1 Tax=Phreatobacter sp. TaxID=1966341 RepID=UPI003F7227DF